MKIKTDSFLAKPGQTNEPKNDQKDMPMHGLQVNVLTLFPDVKLHGEMKNVQKICHQSSGM